MRNGIYRRLTYAAIVMTASLLFAQTGDKPMIHHARGTFTVNVLPLTPPPAEGIARYAIDKKIDGDLKATTKGEMFSAGDPKSGAAGYVAMEVVTGTLAGKQGSFALQHSGTMNASGRSMTVTIVPGSGTGQLQGIAGTFEIILESGKHSYDLAYTLP